MISRRKFLQGSAGMMTLAGTGLSFSFAPRAMASQVTGNTMVLLFFRGGMDALNLLVPRQGENRTQYESKRPNIRIPTSKLLNLDGQFGLPDTCTGLKQLFDRNELAVIHSVGMPDGLGSRSHFDSQTMFDRGTPGQTSTDSGWLARHLASNPALSGSAVISSMTPGNSPESFDGVSNKLAIDGTDTGSFHPNPGRYSDEHVAALQQIFSGNSTRLERAMNGALGNIDLITSLNLSIPGLYPEGNSLASDLALIAQIIKADLGLHVAAVDMGGWDNHENMGDGGTGSYVDRLGQVSAAIRAFFQDLNNSGKNNQVVLATQTEFGRRVRENGNRGTDHGSGQVMLVAGGNINGGQVYGNFPGIRDEELYFNSDLRPTTDFRRPLADLVRNHLGNPNVPAVFPGYSGGLDMGLVRQQSVPLSGEAFFTSGFE